MSKKHLVREVADRAESPELLLRAFSDLYLVNLQVTSGENGLTAPVFFWKVPGFGVC